MEHHLFPVETQLRHAWTTCSEIADPKVEIVPLNDQELHVQRSWGSHPLVSPPEGGGITAPGIAWEASYPEGSINPKSEIPGGFGLYLSGPPGFRDSLSTASEVLFSYSVMFEQGWDFVKGGKLPGVFGGEGSSAYGCAGGRQKERCRCFSLRLMWRQEGSGEVYAYMPECKRNTDELLAVPGSHDNYPYGISVGRGAFVFPPGRWVTIAERVRLNDPGEENGELELWFEGTRVISGQGLIYRKNAASEVKGVDFETFFGGHEKEWASSKDQKAWFANVSGAILG